MAPEHLKILLADDDADDRMLIEEAIQENDALAPVECVENGEELIHYLEQCRKESGHQVHPFPALILLDLNMPKMDGREALERIKSDPDLKKIPVVVLTTSRSEDDIHKTYDLGVSSYITKPSSFDALVDVMKKLQEYWFGAVHLPSNT